MARVNKAQTIHYIRMMVAMGNPVPSAADIAKHFGLKSQTAEEALLRLTADGVLRREWGPGGRSGKYHYELVSP